MKNAGRMATVILTLATAACGDKPASTTGTTDAGEDAGALTVLTHTSSSSGSIDVQVDSHLVMGPNEALLVDGQLLAAEAQAVAQMITQSGRTLKAVFLTHAHPDHYAGFAVIQKAFPAAQFVTTAAVLADFQASAPGTFQYLQSALGNLVADHLVTPTALSGTMLTIDGTSVQVIELPNAGESAHAAALGLPGGALVSGDLLYDHVHLFLGECKSDGWQKNLSAIQAMGFGTIYPGHGKAPVDTSAFADDSSYIGGAIPILRAAEAMDAGASDAGDPRVGAAMQEIAHAFPAFQSTYLLGYSTSTFIDTSKCP